MSKSKKGKKASKNLTIKQMQKLINEKMQQCPFNDRKQLFTELEKWGQELGENGELFLTALYKAESTQQIQQEIALEKGLKRIRGEQ